MIARIVAVCDAYDAMLTKRPYRHARTRSAAITELRRCSGTQFDPEVVEAFVSALDASPTGEMSAHEYAQRKLGTGALVTRSKPASRKLAAV